MSNEHDAADVKLSVSEQKALLWLSVREGIYIYHVPAKNELDEFGDLVPGITLIKKLDKKGFALITEEEPMEDGFEFTPTVELTDEGRMYLKFNEM